MKSAAGFCQRGATLIELVMTIVIISIAVVGVVGAFSALTSHNADPLYQSRSVTLAQLYLDEILAQKYDNATPNGGIPAYTGSCHTGPEAGETRSTYNDVDDYNGLDDKPPRTSQGALGPEYNGYEVKVSVQCAGAEVGLPNANAKRIQVTIIPPDGSRMVFSAYRGNF